MRERPTAPCPDPLLEPAETEDVKVSPKDPRHPPTARLDATSISGTSSSAVAQACKGDGLCNRKTRPRRTPALRISSRAYHCLLCCQCDANAGTKLPRRPENWPPQPLPGMQTCARLRSVAGGTRAEWDRAWGGGGVRRMGRTTVGRCRPTSESFTANQTRSKPCHRASPRNGCPGSQEPSLFNVSASRTRRDRGGCKIWLNGGRFGQGEGRIWTPVRWRREEIQVKKTYLLYFNYIVIVAECADLALHGLRT